MPTYSGFHPYSGYFPEIPAQIVASVAITPGAALNPENAGTTGSLDVAASNEFVQAVYHDKVIAATDSDFASTKTRTVISVIHGMEQLWKARVSAGTAAIASEVWDYADLASATTLTLTDSNKDFRIVKVLDGTANNGVVVGYFATRVAEPTA